MNIQIMHITSVSIVLTNWQIITRILNGMHSKASSRLLRKTINIQTDYINICYAKTAKPNHTKQNKNMKRKKSYQNSVISKPGCPSGCWTNAKKKKREDIMKIKKEENRNQHLKHFSIKRHITLKISNEK